MPTDFFNCAPAATAGGAEAGGMGGGFTWVFLILLVVIMVVTVVLPNKRREKKFKEMIATLKVDSYIKTIGGFYGKIISIKEDVITFECGPDKTKLVVSKSAIASVESFEGGAEVNPK